MFSTKQHFIKVWRQSLLLSGILTIYLTLSSCEENADIVLLGEQCQNLAYKHRKLAADADLISAYANRSDRVKLSFETSDKSTMEIQCVIRSSGVDDAATLRLWQS